MKISDFPELQKKFAEAGYTNVVFKKGDHNVVAIQCYADTGKISHQYLFSFCITNFPHCCAYSIISNYDDCNCGNTLYWEMVVAIANTWAPYTVYAAAEYQTEIMASLEAAGFKKINTVLNHGSGNNVSMYIHERK
jgi:hypothetical protein